MRCPAGDRPLTETREDFAENFARCSSGFVEEIQIGKRMGLEMMIDDDFFGRRSENSIRHGAKTVRLVRVEYNDHICLLQKTVVPIAVISVNGPVRIQKSIGRRSFRVVQNGHTLPAGGEELSKRHLAPQPITVGTDVRSEDEGCAVFQKTRKLLQFVFQGSGKRKRV